MRTDLNDRADRTNSGFGVARSATALAAMCCASMPAVMVVANKSSPLILVLCAAGLLFSFCIGLNGAQGLSRKTDWLHHPAAMALAAGAVFAIASALWSVDRSTSLGLIFQCIAPVTAGIVAVRLGPGRLPDWLMPAVMFGSAGAAILFLVEQRFGMPIRDLTGGRKMLFELNRPALVLLLYAIPLLAWVTARRFRYRSTAIFGLGLIVTVLIVTDSMTTQLSAVAALGAFLLGRLFPRLATWLVVAAMVTALWLAPRMGELANAVVSPQLETRLATGSPAARIAIWSSFGEAARVAPFHGTGFGTTATLREADVSAKVSEARRDMLGAGHPHNAYLQIAVEFGAVGQIMTTIILLAIGWSIMRRAPDGVAPRLALLAAVGAASLVGHGAWQAWWIAAIFMSMMLIENQDFRFRESRGAIA